MTPPAACQAVRCNWRAVGWRTLAPLLASFIQIRGYLDSVEPSAACPANNAPVGTVSSANWGTIFRQTLNNAGGYFIKLCPFLHRLALAALGSVKSECSDERSHGIGKEAHELGKIVQGD